MIDYLKAEMLQNDAKYPELYVPVIPSRSIS